MRHPLAMIVLLAALAVAFTGVARAADGTFDLAYHLTKGETYKLMKTMNQHIVQKVQGNTITVDQKIGIGYTFAVKDVADDGTATIDVTFDRLLMKIDMMQGKFEYDSEDPPDQIPPPAQALATLLGKSFTMKLTRLGKVTETSGVDDMLKDMLETIDAPEGPVRDKMIADMQKQFGDAGLKETFDGMLDVYPDHAVAMGDSWTKTVSVSHGLPMTLETTYTLADRQDGVATLKVESAIKPNPDAATTKMGPTTMRFEPTGTLKGEIDVDEATGWLVEGDLSQEIDGKVIVSGVPGQPETTVPMIVKGTYTYETE